MGFDSHCHLDQTTDKLVVEKSIQWPLQLVPETGEFKLELPRVVCVFCDQETYPSQKKIWNDLARVFIPQSNGTLGRAVAVNKSDFSGL